MLYVTDNASFDHRAVTMIPYLMVNGRGRNSWVTDNGMRGSWDPTIAFKLPSMPQLTWPKNKIITNNASLALKF